MRFYLTAFIFFFCYYISKSEIKFGIYTDVHYDPNFDDRGTIKNHCHKDSTKEGLPKKYGTFGCDAPFILINETIHQMERTVKNPNAYLFLGDFITHYKGKKLENDSNKSDFDLLKQVIELVTNESINTLKSPIFFCFGNHDFPIEDQGPAPDLKTEYYTYFYNLWFKTNPFMKEFDTDENLHSFLNGGYYSVIFEKENLKIIVLNTIYFGERSETDLEEADKQLEWIDYQLFNAYLNKQKVIIMMHAPSSKIFLYNYIHMFWKDKFNKKYLSILAKYGNIVTLSLAGHLHSSFYQYDKINAKKRFNNINNGQQQIVNNLYIAKSVTPLVINNPGFELLVFNNDSYPTKIIEYSFNLAEYDKNPTEDVSKFWYELYDSSSEIKMPDLSPKSFEGFAFHTITNPLLWAKWVFLKFGYSSGFIYEWLRFAYGIIFHK